MTGLAALSTPQKWDVFVAKRQGITRDLPPGQGTVDVGANIGDAHLWPAGHVLVDALLTVEQAQALVEWVAASGKNLTTIYVTHGHGDHFLASEPSWIAFPMPERSQRPML
jgi:glyoxylase-like metal-dependent hydrolase (beta-lactamase superfamily II)